MSNKKLKAAVERLEELNRDLDIEVILMFFGRPYVENEDEREYVLWRSEQEK
jgi:hypothetical protein